MKNLFLFLFLSISLQAFGIKASVDFLRFSNLDQQYVEVNYRIFAKSINHDSLNAVSVLSTIVIYQNDEIVDYQKNLIAIDPSTKDKDLLDVRRFVLAPGDYRIDVELDTQREEDSVFKVEKRLSILPVEPSAISDIMLLSTAVKATTESQLVKNGIYMESLPYRYYDKEQDLLLAYVEMYDMINLNPAAKTFFSYGIQSSKSSSGEYLAQKFKLTENKDIQAHILRLPLNNIPSGSYTFVIEVHDEQKNIIARQSTNFINDNPEADIKQLSLRSKDIATSFVNHISKDSLDYHLKALMPITFGDRKSVLTNVIESNANSSKRGYLHEYWTTEAGESAEAASFAYMKIARAVDKKFYNGTSYGFDTDMGYIFLRYGKPNDAIEVDNELSTPPYQIWRYEQINSTGESNVKFLFYAPSLSHRDYRLLHSTCRVELQNPSWEVELYRKIPEEHIRNGGESTRVNDGFTRRARDLWEDF